MTSERIFEGTCTALITPFDDEGGVDFDAARNLVRRQIAGGVDAVAVLGATGEDSSLTLDERRELAETIISEVDGRVPVIVGAGSASTRESVAMAREAQAWAGDAVMVVAPYYCRPTPEGVRAHLSEVAMATDLPLIFYHVPFRTGITVPAAEILKMADEIKSLRAVKECTGDLNFVAELFEGKPNHFDVYSGDEEATLHIIQLGGIGIISAFSNVAPAAMAKLVRAALEGDWDTARQTHFSLLPAFRDCFSVSNPLPAKSAMSSAGLCPPGARLPLIPLGESYYRENLKALAAVVE